MRYIFTDKKKKNSLIFCIILALIQVVILKDIDILIMILIFFIFSNDKEYEKDIIKYYLISLITVFGVTIILYKLGVLKSAYLSRKSGKMIIQRNSLGFKHPNEAYFYYFSILLAIYYFFNNKHYLLFLVLTSGTSYLMYNITLSRTGLFCTIIFIAITTLNKIFHWKKINVCKYVYIICTIISFCIAFIGKNQYNSINLLLSYRPYLYYSYIKNGYILNVIGNKLIRDVTIDNMYLHEILSSGIIFYIFYAIIFYLSGKRIMNNIRLSIIIIILSIYGLFESHVLNVGINFALIIQFISIFKYNNDIYKEENLIEKNRNT